MAAKSETTDLTTTAPEETEALWKHFSRLTDLLFGVVDDVTDYKNVVLGLIFLKYISDSFKAHHDRFVAEQTQGDDPEHDHEFFSHGIFRVSPEAWWPYLVAQAEQPTIGRLVDVAISAIERDNSNLQGVFPKECIHRALERSSPGKLIDLVNNIKLGDGEASLNHFAGRAYEYLLSQFARAEGWRGGEFYTPYCVVKLLVEMTEPLRGRIYDPCCGSASVLVQAAEFCKARTSGDGSRARTDVDISIHGQESNFKTWQLAKMNLAIRGIDAQVVHGNTFHDDRCPDLEADFILANPPFNISDWGGDRLKEDKRWKYGIPPMRNGNFAWLQHVVSHMAPGGVAGIVLSECSMSSSQSSERRIRQTMVEAGIVECMVALPGQLFYSTPAPACLWLLARGRGPGKLPDRRGEILFIDAGELGQGVERTHRELTDQDIARIAETYQAWRRDNESGDYADLPGFCRSVTLEEIREQSHVLTPRRYVGSAAHHKTIMSRHSIST